LASFTGQNGANFIIGLTNIHPLVNSPVIGNYNVCGQYPGVVPRGATIRLQCENANLQQARYVIVQIEITKIMRICELEVYTPEGLAVYRFENAANHVAKWFVVVKFSGLTITILTVHVICCEMSDQ